MADEFLDFFTQLFHSTEIWGYLGIIGTICFGLVVVYKIRVAFPLFAVMFGLWGVDYLQMSRTEGPFIYHAIFLFISAVFITVLGIQGLSK